ncbi:hypothetical protein N7541_000588 [Penicillium brevicompactum]|uniref:Nephrocystin 3-like N-terminal domain-containing protein n=1 Tax=Penicillium brevicompactum TaxID=5074 RepID=A0A9W9RUR1_PENBR|nr:hypothetical protein N7541_000588 [Penicillium brevicompactum]
MPTSDSERSDTVMVGRDDVHDYNENNILPLPASDLKAIREWLQPTPYDAERSEFARHLESYLAGTGKWLISTNTYQEWHSGDTNGLLWIKGIPGSGKSVMAASIIQQLRKEHVPVLHFFFRQIIDANHQPVAVLRDWLCQLLPFSPALQVRLKDVYLDKSRTIDSVSVNDLWKDIRFALSTFSKAYCVIDALDEMDQGNDDFLQAVVELGQWRPANIKVLISSRPVVAVESPLRPFSVPFIRLDEQLVDIDIAAYVQHRLQNSSVPEEHWSTITEAVPGRANGLFLYARLSLDAFTKPGADPQDVLKKLPKDLNVMYDELLREHAKRSNVPDNLQLLILQSITHATRPLRLLEVAEMIKATHTPLETSSLKEIKNLVRAACGPLLQILHDETVSVVHHSFTEFLKGMTRTAPLSVSAYSILEAGPTNHRLAIACLDYLMSGCLENLEVKKRNKYDDFYHPKKAAHSELRLRFPFLEYAATNWYIHTRRAELAGVDLSSFFSVLDEFVANKNGFVAWLDIDWPVYAIQGLTPLHAAAKSGLSQYTAHLIQNSNADPNAKCNKGDTPLFWAVSSGYAEVAQILIDNGADPDGECHEGLKPLHEAAGSNRAEVVKVLLAAGVDPLTPKTREAPGMRCGNAPTSVGHTPLMYACSRGHTKAVAEFLPYLDDQGIKRALFWLAGSGHAAGVAYILERATVDVNETQKQETQLYKACLKSDLDTIKVLLAAGADPNILCAYPWEEFGGIGSNMHRLHQDPKAEGELRGFTALHALCGISGRQDRPKSSLDCVSAIIDAGADVHIKSNDGKTALHFACTNNISIVKMLLEAGADPYAKDDKGDTILHTDGKKDKELLPILQESGLVDVDKIMIESNGGPLFSRLWGNYPKSALEFLKFKMDLNVIRSNGNGPLHIIFNGRSSDHDDDVLDGFLSAGADPNLCNDKGDSPLHLVERQARIETIQKLLKAGANIEIRDALGQTPLFKAVTYSPAWKGKIDLFKTLIEQGARLDTRDNAGRTLLHQVVDNIERLEELILLMKFDPSVVDNDGNTLLHELASRKRKPDGNAMYERLMDLGVDIEQPNYRGRTMLHQLSSQSSDRMSHANTQLDYVVQHHKNKSPKDLDGVQPLHFAAAVSEDNVFKLLNSGADLFGVTKEGMTVLHVAARAQNPGAVNLILARLVDLDDKARKAFINLKNSEGNAALHFACISGRPETVNLLLNAGADPNLLGKSGYTPLRACADFEAEQTLWSAARIKDKTKALKKASIRLTAIEARSAEDGNDGHQWRKTSLWGHDSESTRLGEILNDLVLHGAQATLNNSLRDALYDSLSNQRDYTTECLLNLQSRLFPSMDLVGDPHSESFALYKSRVESERLLLTEKNEDKQRPKTGQSLSYLRIGHMRKLLGYRQYGLLEETVTEKDTSLLCSRNISILHVIVSAGLFDTLAKLGTPEIARKFDDHEWCDHAEEVNKINSSRIKPLLIVACSRDLPNMEVVQILVEKLGVNINTNCRKLSYETGGAKTIAGNGVLHGLAKCQTWWGVHHALPYLIKKGADLGLRNGDGDTPLHVACSPIDWKGVFYKEAVKTLLDNGADVNAINSKGETCLSKAGTDVELIKILLSYGAKVSAAAIISAIESGNVELLEHFLSQGDLANVRRDDFEDLQRKVHPFERIRIPKAEVYPLFLAAMSSSPISFPAPKIDLAPFRSPMMSLLLQHGANPYATFVQFHRVNRDSPDSDEESEGSKAGPAVEWKPETCTVIHEIFKASDHVEPLLRLPSLQLESRDDKGRTLILCTNRTSRIQSLIDRGADITAQDKSGKTVIHNLVTCQSNLEITSTIKALLFKEPRLVHIGDKAGDTPLHYVLREARIDFKHVSLLLEHGANPLQPDSDGNTALHYLATRPSSHKDHIHRFMKLGVDINFRNKEGNTPLFHYVSKGKLRSGGLFGYKRSADPDDDTKSLRFLKDLGSDFFARNNAGMSLLHVVAGRKIENAHFSRLNDSKEPIENLVQWFEFLRATGLDPMLEDSQQRTSLDFAAACGNEHILKLFKHKDGRE